MIHYIEVSKEADDSIVSYVQNEEVLKKFVHRVKKKLNTEKGKSEIDYKILMKYRSTALDYAEALRVSNNKKLNKDYYKKLNMLVKEINKLLEVR